MWELNHKEGCVPKNWCWRRLLRVPWTPRRPNQSILKEINPEYSLEGLMRKLKAPILWPPDAKSRLTGKDPDARKDWGQEKKRETEDEMAGWHHWLNGHAAAAAAKSLLNRFCDPTDGSPPGYAFPGILQARTLEWVAFPSPRHGKWSRSVVSDSSRPHGLQPTRLLCPWVFQARDWSGVPLPSPQWTWVWANSGRWWRTEKPGVLQSMGSKRVGHNNW